MNYTVSKVQKQYGDLQIDMEVFSGEERRNEGGDFTKVKEMSVGAITSVQYLQGGHWVDLPKDVGKSLTEYHRMKAEVGRAKAI